MLALRQWHLLQHHRSDGMQGVAECVVLSGGATQAPARMPACGASTLPSIALHAELPSWQHQQPDGRHLSHSVLDPGWLSLPCWLLLCHRLRPVPGERLCGGPILRQSAPSLPWPQPCSPLFRGLRVCVTFNDTGQVIALCCSRVMSGHSPPGREPPAARWVT